MRNLKLLQLINVRISGSYENFPKGLRWLHWHGFPLQSIPNDFPIEKLVVLEMPFSSLRNVWDGSKFLELLKILDLRHSYSLAETPEFSVLPNLERLILKSCVRLVKVHESIECLDRLFMLNLRDCRSLRKLPESIGKLKYLEALNIGGCSSLEKLPTEIGNMESLKVLRADGIAINRLFSNATWEVKVWYSFIWPWLLKPRSPDISWVSLPRSLVCLSLVNCNLSDDAFPRDLRSLSSLRELNLSANPICRLPDCNRDLTWLQILCLQSCPRFLSVRVQHKLKNLRVRDSILLRQIRTPAPCSTYYDNCDHLVEVEGKFKLEPIGNVDVEIINNLGLSNLESMRKRNVKLISPFLSKPLPVQGCHERHIFYTYIPGSKVPANWFNLKNIGSSISFTVPPPLNLRIRGLSACSVLALSDNKLFKNPYRRFKSDVHTIISNTTKRLKWSHCPRFLGVPEAADDDDDMMMCLSFWKFENPFEGGDELNVSVVTGEDFQVKEVGVHFVLEEEEEERGEEKKSTTQSNSAIAAREIRGYGNVVPTKFYANSELTKVYLLGLHRRNCEYCPQRLSLQRLKYLDGRISHSEIMMPWAPKLMTPYI